MGQNEVKRVRHDMLKLEYAHAAVNSKILFGNHRHARLPHSASLLLFHPSRASLLFPHPCILTTLITRPICISAVIITPYSKFFEGQICNPFSFLFCKRLFLWVLRCLCSLVYSELRSLQIYQCQQ